MASFLSVLIAGLKGLSAIKFLVEELKRLNNNIEKKHKSDMRILASKIRVQYPEAKTDKEIFDALDKLQELQQG